MSECLRCGLCCISADVLLEKITAENKVFVMDRLRWFNLHRCDSMIITHKDGSQQGLLSIPLICRNLSQDKGGKYFCKDYANRPKVCKDFLCARAKE